MDSCGLNYVKLTYDVAFIVFCNHLVRKNKMMEAIPAMNTNSIKKSFKIMHLIACKLVTLVPSGYKALNFPASTFEPALARNHTAINNEANFTGDNLFTNDKPIGDKHSSPQVWKAYIPTNQIMLTLTPWPTSFTPTAITK